MLFLKHRKPKIRQIAVCCTETFFYTVGLDNKGDVWLWNKFNAAWEPHYIPPEEAQNLTPITAGPGPGLGDEQNSS